MKILGFILVDRRIINLKPMYMKINATLLTIFLIPFWSYSQNQVPMVTNVTATIDTSIQLVNVSFDLNDAEGDLMEVWIQASTDGGNTWVVPIVLDSLSGDYGMAEVSGTGKSISWSYDETVLSAYSSGLTTMRVRVIADDHITIPLSEIVAKIDSARIVSTLFQYEGIRHHTANPVFKDKIKDSLEAMFDLGEIYNYRQGSLYGSYQTANIVGFSSGTRTPSNSWMTSGHYDSVDDSPGADDNGTGMVAVAEAIRVLSDYKTKNSIRYFFFDLEEQGLIGSQKYVQTGIPFWENMQGLLNMDGIGYYSDTANSQSMPAGFNIAYPTQYTAIQADNFKGNFINSFYNTASTSLDSAFNAVATTYVPDLKVISFETPGTGTSTPDFRRSDHARFWDISVPAIFLNDAANYRNPFYHTPNDSIHYLDMDFLVNNIKAIVTTLAMKAELEHSGCAQSNDLEIELPLTVSVNTPTINSVLVFPNPSVGTQTFQISLEEPGMVRMLIMDITGKLIDATTSQWMLAGTNSIHHSKELSTGTYQVLLEVDGSISGSSLLVVSQE